MPSCSSNKMLANFIITIFIEDFIVSSTLQISSYLIFTLSCKIRWSPFYKWEDWDSEICLNMWNIQGYTLSKWQSKNSNPDYINPIPILLSLWNLVSWLEVIELIVNGHYSFPWDVWRQLFQQCDIIQREPLYKCNSSASELEEKTQRDKLISILAAAANGNF